MVCLRLGVEASREGCTLTIETTHDQEEYGPHPLKLALKRLLHFNVALRRRALRGDLVELSVHARGEPLGKNRLPASTDVVRPLLPNCADISGLYPYQEEGRDWLLANPRALLGDEMGLGKTVQAFTEESSTLMVLRPPMISR